MTERPPPSEVQRLQEQNASLREAVARMREDMEALSGRLLPSALLGGEAADSGQRDPKVAADAAIPGEQGERETGTEGGRDRGGRREMGVRGWRDRKDKGGSLLGPRRSHLES